jgi:hypothetical protein
MLTPTGVLAQPQSLQVGKAQLPAQGAADVHIHLQRLGPILSGDF